MSHVTTQLGDESGIQYQGADDKNNINQIGDMSNMLMLVENVPRGRLDKEMTITKANMKSLLGQEKGNLYLQAVDDALDTKVQSIKVLRVLSTDNKQPQIISCANATDNMNLFSIAGIWEIYLDGILVVTDAIGNGLSHLINVNQGKLTGDYDGFLYIQNIDDIPHRLRFVPVQDTEFSANTEVNPSFATDDDGGFYFCLASPNNNQNIGCEGAIDHITVASVTDGGLYRVYLNDEMLETNNNFMFRTDGIASKLKTLGIDVAALTNMGLPSIDIGNAARARFVNNTENYQKIRIELLDADSIDMNLTPENQTFNFSSGTTSFCLAPKSTDTCFPTINSFNFNDDYMFDAGTYFLRYRINNGEIILKEIRYTEDQYYFIVIRDVFEGINYPNLVTNPAVLAAAFNLSENAKMLTGANKDDVTVDQPISIEFIAEQEDPTNLGWLIFGSTTTIHSCGLKNWNSVME